MTTVVRFAWPLGVLGLLQTTGCAPHGDGSGLEPPVVAAGSPLLVASTSSLSSMAVAMGSDFACALAVSGHVKCWGGNGSGQLGTGNTGSVGDNALYDYVNFVDLGAGRTAKAISAGGGTVCAILDTNQVKCWGENGLGQLGLGDTSNRGDGAGEMGDALPVVNLGTGRTAKAISTSGGHTCAVLDNNQLKCWGRNASGQLGQDDITNRGSSASQMGDNLLPIFLGTGRTAKAVATGGDHTCAVLDNNKVRCFGRNEFAELGIAGTGPHGIAPGDMAALTDVNLGTGRTAKVATTPIGVIAAAYDRTCVVLDNAQLKCWGNNQNDLVGVGVPDTKVGVPPCEISSPGAGCTGGQSNAQIALGTGRTALSVSMAGDHICAVLDNSQVKCWGDNGSGQLGLGDMTAHGATAAGMGQGLPSVALGAGRTARGVAAAPGFTCAVLDNYKLKCWGNGSSYQLGNMGFWNVGDEANELGDNLSPVLLGSRAAKAVAAGTNHTCAIYSTGALTCWGSNGSGRLGLSEVTVGGYLDSPVSGYAVNLGSTAKAVSPGFSHSCAINSSNLVKCWGSNASGELGLGDTTQRSVPASSTVALGTGLTAQSLSVGISYSCALLSNNLVKCWGANDVGQLGLGDTTTRTSPSSSTIDLGTGLTVKKLASGRRHSCVILNDNSVKCWGANEYGQLGLGNTNHRGDASGEMGTSLLAVSLGTGRTAKAIAVGGYHTCAILDTNAVKCWGRNSDGQLGLGDPSHRGDQANEMGNALPVVLLGGGRTAKAIVAGESSNCALLDNDTVKCWGNNPNGQLGVGDYVDRGNSLGNMGDFLPVVALGMKGGLIASQLTMGRDHTCALLNSSQMNCWGGNDFGQTGGSLGFASPLPQETPVDLGIEP